MSKAFETDRFDLVDTDKVRIADHRFGRDGRGELNVWVETGATGKRFSRQITTRGGTNAARHGVYTRDCYFLRERSTGRYLFLEADGRGFYLYTDDFFGAQAFLGHEAETIGRWLAALAHVPPTLSVATRLGRPAQETHTVSPPETRDTATRVESGRVPDYTGPPRETGRSLNPR